MQDKQNPGRPGFCYLKGEDYGAHDFLIAIQASVIKDSISKAKLEKNVAIL
jgi:hypothetical protein